VAIRGPLSHYAAVLAALRIALYVSGRGRRGLIIIMLIVFMFFLALRENAQEEADEAPQVVTHVVTEEVTEEVTREVTVEVEPSRTEPEQETTA
jgi:hypothetical protein